MKNLFLWGQRQRMSPFPNYLSMESIVNQMQNTFGVSFNVVANLYKENHMYVLFDKNDLNKINNKSLNIIKNNPYYFKTAINEVKKEGENLIKFLKSIIFTKKKKYSNKELIFFFKKYAEIYKKMYSWYFPVILVERPLIDYLRSYLSKKLKKNELDANLKILISEPKALINLEEEIASLKLAIKIYENKKWKGLIESGHDLSLTPDLKKLIINHEKSFFWITRDYEDPVLTYNDFLNKIKVQLKNNPKKLYEEKIKYIFDIKKKINKIEKDLNIDNYHKKLFQCVRDSLFLKEFRKSYTSKSLYYFDFILDEISIRTNLSIREIRHINVEDIEKVFLDKQFQNEIKKRVNLSLFYITKDKTSICINKKASEIYNQFCLPKKIDNKLNGISVSSGKAKGLAKVVMNPNELHKVNKGDIIISTQIVPSFASVLKKSVGLVCDGGSGITSHSAILSREAGIPCVTATSFATKIIKDGDLIEIDANNGIVKILKR